MAAGLKRFLPNLIGVVAYGWLVFCLFRTWQNPLSFDDGRWVKLGINLLYLEMILVISGAIYSGITDPSSNLMVNGELLTDERKRSFQRGAAPWVLTGIFVLAGMGFGVVLGMMSLPILQILAGTMFSRLIGFFWDSEQVQAAQRIRFMAGAGLYLVVVILVGNLPCPIGGMTPEVLEKVGLPKGMISHPERKLWAAMIYFGLLGLLEVLLSLFSNRLVKQVETVTGADS